MRKGPVVIGYDGTPGSEHAIREAGELLGDRTALVVVVHKQGLGFELVENPTATLGLPPAQLDIRTALEVDRSLAERSQRLAQRGAQLARDAGLVAEGMAVADDVDTPVSETLIRVAKESDAKALVIGTQGHGRIGDVVLGATTRDVIRHAPCPVVAVRRYEE